MKDCVFCKIVKGELPSTKIYEDSEIIAFKDIKPLAPVHYIIVPKKHIKNLNEVKKEDSDLLGKIQFISSELAKKLNIADGFRVSCANEKKGGQSIFHLHYHLMGGWKEVKDFRV
ncbi:histidine triad nucleotide-binding protein [Patescibacteria group bacterium]